MLRNVGRAFALVGGCSIVMGLGIASCSDEPPPEGLGEASELEAVDVADAAVPGAVAPPAALRRIDAPPCVLGIDCPTEFPDPFAVAELGQSDTHLYVALRYQGRPPVEGVALETASPRVNVAVDGCKQASPTARGIVARSRVGLSWLEIPLSALPEDEFDLGVHAQVGALVVSRTLPLAKAGSTVKFVDSRSSKHSRIEKVADPTTGQTMQVLVHTGAERDCAQ